MLKECWPKGELKDCWSFDKSKHELKECWHNTRELVKEGNRFYTLPIEIIKDMNIINQNGETYLAIHQSYYLLYNHRGICSHQELQRFMHYWNLPDYQIQMKNTKGFREGWPRIVRFRYDPHPQYKICLLEDQFVLRFLPTNIHHRFYGNADIILDRVLPDGTVCGKVDMNTIFRQEDKSRIHKYFSHKWNNMFSQEDLKEGTFVWECREYQPPTFNLNEYKIELVGEVEEEYQEVRGVIVNSPF